MGKSGESSPSFFGDGTNHYDEHGRKVGSSSPGFFGDHVNHYDEHGRKVGESSPSFFGNETIHYDASGHRIGSSGPSFFGNGTNHYDEHGHKVGESGPGFFGDHTNHYDHSFGSSAGFSRSSDRSSSFGSYGYSGIGSSLQRSPKPLAPGVKGRFQLLGLYVVLAIGGVIAATVLSVGIFLIASILYFVPAFANLQAAILGPDRQAGPMMIVSWLLVCAGGFVLNNVLYSRLVDDVSYGAFLGALAGAAVLVVLGMFGLFAGWGQLVPVVGAAAGLVIGILRAWSKRNAVDR